MVKKGLIVLILLIFISGAAFAQQDFASMPKNTVSVDIGPTFLGISFGMLSSLIDMGSASTTGFGIGAQYERQLFPWMSVGARYAYLGFGFGLEERYGGDTVTLNMDLATHNPEAFVRLYPFSGAFFASASAGWQIFSAGFSGQAVIGGSQQRVSFTASRNYIKFGGKLGWRIDFGRPGGFIFEPSFGWDFPGIGMGETIGAQLTTEVGGEVEGFNEVFQILETFIFVGGPRVTLSFGWRF
jgi:hypothetical protein